ncbi:MAG: hypothetical protein AAGK32_06385, partial [Actinomycetota bacterium]
MADEEPHLSLRARRRVLVALGFGAANVAVGSVVGLRPRVAAGDGDGRTVQMADMAASLSIVEPPALADAADQPGPEHRYQLVVANGRVIDPDSGFDATAQVGIDD